MYLLGMIHFFCAYLCYKYLFVDFYRMTYGFDEDIPLYSVRLMKWAIFFHLLMIMFMYTNKRLLTPNEYNPEIHYRPVAEPADKFFKRRYDTFSNFTVLLLVILLIIFYVLWRCIIVTILNICRVKDDRKKSRGHNPYEEDYAGD